MRKYTLLLILVAALTKGYSQCKDCHDGKHDWANNFDRESNQKNGKRLPPDSSGGLAQSFVLQNVCGLNWEQTSVKVTTRYPTPPGTGLPATVPLTFSACNVDSVVKAFLYFNGSYQTAYAANPATVIITNPAAVVTNYLADSIGTGPNKCWAETGTIAYRVDVTSCIAGGGNYTIDLQGTGLTDWAVDGITFVIIYIDKSATYSGSISLWDGLYTTGGGSHSQTFSGFNVCNATPSGQAFSILADMQSNVSGGINTQTYNGSTQTFSNLFYNFCTVTTPLTTGQTSTTYSVYTNDGGDCYSWVLAGLYWQNSNCQTCNPTVLATNTITIVPPRDTICQGDSIQLTASGDSSYIWAPATGLSCTSCPNPKASPNATTTYTVTGFIGCAIGIDTVQVVVNPHVTLTVTPTATTVCTGTPVQINVSGGNNYVWTPATDLSCTTCSNPIATPTTSITYTVTSGTSGCLNTATVSITVLTTPTLSISPISPKICHGDSVQLTAIGASNYRWIPTTNLSCTTCPNPYASPTVTTVYKVVGGITGCRDSLFDTVYVGPATFGTITAIPDSVCQGDTVLLIGGGGGIYAWSTGQTNDSIMVEPATTKTYTLIVANGACKDTTKKTVNITPKISATVSVINDTVCPHSPTTILANISGGPGTYIWSNGATTSSITVNDTVSTTYTAAVVGKCNTVNLTQKVIVIPLPKPVIKGTPWKCKGVIDTLTVTGGTKYIWSNGITTTTYKTGPIDADSTIKVYAFNSLGCEDSITFTVDLRVAPNVTVSPTTLACAGNDVVLQASATGVGPFTYTWAPGGATTDTVTVNPSSKTTYTVTVSNGCKSTKSTIVTPDNPGISACCNKAILIGDDTIITAKGGSTIKTYSWTPSVICLNPLCDSVKVTPTVTTTYTVTATDSLGCQIERVVTIVVETPCFDFNIPNVITPDNPGPLGLNGMFYIKTQNLNSWSLTIFDRWGKEMFKSSNPIEYWTGTTEGGAKATDGVYYYIINATCQGNSYKKDGFLQLIR